MTESGWKLADLLVKALAVALISALVSIYGIRLEKTRKELARQDSRLDTLVEFASAQKKLDVDVGMQLFRAFIDKYLDVSVAEPEQIKENMVLLRLIALNFQDVPINLKPLFEDLDERLSRQMPREPSGTKPLGPTGGKDDPRDPFEQLRKELRDIAREVANRQAYRLTFLHGHLEDSGPVKEGGVRYFEEATFAVKVNSIRPDGVEVEIRETEFDDEFNERLRENGKKIGPFYVSYYDMPLLDNVKADVSMRLAVLLKSVDDATVTIRLVSFPSHLATDRFDVKELSSEYTTALFGEKTGNDVHP